MAMENRIGFMQGRLSPIIDGKIQSFPWNNWKEEFIVGDKNNFHLLEWTLDQVNLYKNPLLSIKGRVDIKNLSTKHKIKIPSLTGDCFMQAPFWKAYGETLKELEKDFLNISKACKELDISFIVIPIVDNGSIENKKQEDHLVGFLIDNIERFRSNNQKIVFESDFEPKTLSRFIERFDSEYFGINYDIGNSAALGYSVEEEFKAYGNKIMNVHVKDREYRGTTVPLGEGNANFNKVFEKLGSFNYKGNFILQTARAIDDNHLSPLMHYRDMTSEWMHNFHL